MEPHDTTIQLIHADDHFGVMELLWTPKEQTWIVDVIIYDSFANVTKAFVSFGTAFGDLLESLSGEGGINPAQLNREIPFLPLKIDAGDLVLTPLGWQGGQPWSFKGCGIFAGLVIARLLTSRIGTDIRKRVKQHEFHAAMDMRAVFTEVTAIRGSNEESDE